MGIKWSKIKFKNWGLNPLIPHWIRWHDMTDGSVQSQSVANHKAYKNALK